MEVETRSRIIRFTLNGERCSISSNPVSRTSDVLREELGLIGTKVGCDAGDCGACTILINGEQRFACLTAVGQLEVWAKKINAEIVKSDEGADPASVAYKAFDYAKKNNFDYLIIDTAGRLQNKKNLMDEFKKIINVLKKIDIKSPHEIFLILDATTGQSAINQVEEFKKISQISGIIMTKLDGTAKGGILLAVGKKFKLPIVALGMGEKEDDLEIFNAEHFAKAIMTN